MEEINPNQEALSANTQSLSLAWNSREGNDLQIIALI